MEAVMANSNKIILTSYKMHALPFIKKNKKKLNKVIFFLLIKASMIILIYGRK